MESRVFVRGRSPYAIREFRVKPRIAYGLRGRLRDLLGYFFRQGDLIVYAVLIIFEDVFGGQNLVCTIG